MQEIILTKQSWNHVKLFERKLVQAEQILEDFEISGNALCEDN